MLAGLKALRENPIIRTFSAAGRASRSLPRASWWPQSRAVLRTAIVKPSCAGSICPRPADPALPSLFLIGDSTVRNGRGDGLTDWASGAGAIR